MFEDFFAEIRKHLKYISQNSSHYLFRCPFCGDSSNTSKGHLYISKDKPVYRCARCGESGHYSKLLNLFKINNVILPKSSFGSNHTITSGYSSFVKYTISDAAEEYLNERLGLIDIDPDEINIISTDEMKCIYSGSPKYNPGRRLPVDSVNFLTYNKKKIVCRVYGEEDLQFFGRYDNIVLSEGHDVYVLNNRRIYSEYIKHKTIVIGEGIFDILNTYYNVRIFPKDSVYVAALNAHIGKAFEIGSAVALSFYPKIVVLADADKKDNDYLKCIPYSFRKNVSIYRNTIGKDFGEKNVKYTVSYGEDVSI